MDALSKLVVRFHFNGEFINDGMKVHYVGGRDAMSYINRDKVSLAAIVGHLRDHCTVEDGALVHWLFPGKELYDGLRVLTDDKTCLQMADAIMEGEVAEIYVEVAAATDGSNDEGGQGSGFENEQAMVDVDSADEEGGHGDVEGDDQGDSDDDDVAGEDAVILISAKPDSREVAERQIKKLKEFHRSPSKKGKDAQVKKDKGKQEEEKQDEDEHSSSDSDYMRGDDSSSEADNEGVDILRKFKDFKKDLKRGHIASLDDVVLEGSTAMPAGFEGSQDDGSETAYAQSSDDVDSMNDLDSDGELSRKDNSFTRFKETTGTPIFALGMLFKSKKQFKKAIIRYGLAERKVINFIKNEPKRVRAKCDWKACPWVCLLSINSRTESWQIVTFNDYHTCPPRRDNRLVTARRIAEKYEKFIMANPTWKFVSMKQTVQEEMFADVSISKLKKAKAMVMQKAFDATKGQYELLYDYQLELLRSNPGSTVIVTKEPGVEPPTFQRMYICLDALKKGFLAGCRRVVGFEGCFFKGATNGELLCAIGRDANNQMYPIAWAVVEKETNDSWGWFCDLLFKDLGVGDGTDWVFISDQKKGILKAVSYWAPQAEHRNCARHIYANWKQHFSDKEWQKKFWRCAKAPCIMLFNRARERLAGETREGAQAILNTRPQHWSRAWFRLGSNCDSVDNNLCGSFNKWIVEARFFPVITMLETIRRKVMARIHDNRTKSESWVTKICPNILKKLNVYITQSGKCHAICNGASNFEVMHFDTRFKVDLEEKECLCRYWQLSGLPCPHAISCILLKTNSLDEYVASCYSVESFKNTYEHCLQPIEDMTNWPVSDRVKLKAPDYVWMPGRPKTERRDPTEAPKGTKLSRVGTVIRCTKCKQTGHNRSTCEKRNAAASSGTVGVQSAASPNAMAVVSNTQQSCTSSRKRKAPAGSSHGAPVKNVTKTSASARVSTIQGGSATGKAGAHVSASATKITRPDPKQGPMLLLPPWESAKL
ncbi:uncharacterized protein LOC101779108 [Setaria italica]|uniref:uncharacterized protein LOC101779108 n=1 Tax=Setaria italica TaxID=4555 RepID=UPI000350DB5F|nr:uncharacterized protein LOC101779108 [Setaria italica]XP_004953071.1 uncharacterized protein LOC101779108 [Setaria italica]